MINDSVVVGDEPMDYREAFGFRKGYYFKPHYLVEMVKERLLLKAEYILLDLLFSLQNQFAKQPGDWFYHVNDNICATKLLSLATLIKARRGLKIKKLIDFKEGHSHTATQYKILIIPQHYSSKT